MATALARAVVAFHAVKLAGVLINLVTFPVLGTQAPASARVPAVPGRPKSPW